MRSAKNCFVLLFSISLSAFAADNTPQSLIAKHLDSIGTTQVRAAIKTRGIQGPLRLRDVGGRVGDLTGYWGLVSEQNKINFVMKFGNGEWHGERFVFDGNKPNFAVFTSSRRPSSFGQFIQWQDFVLRQGLLGGELSTAWLLQTSEPASDRFSYLGLKKVDGNELETLEYRPKGSDMNVKFYFDPATYHHVMTVYTLEWSPGMAAGGPANQAELRQVRYLMEERFSDFQTQDGITLPRHYNLRYTQDVQGSPRMYEWDMTAEKVLNNINLDPQNFQIK